MKMKSKDYNALSAAITPLDTAERRDAYRSAGLTALRYRWDLVYAAFRPNVEGASLSWFCDTMYDYLDDTHIDTALRKICSMGTGPEIPVKE